MPKNGKHIEMRHMDGQEKARNTFEMTRNTRMKENNQKTTKTEAKKLGNTWNCKEKEDKGEENVRIHRKI